MIYSIQRKLDEIIDGITSKYKILVLKMMMKVIFQSHNIVLRQQLWLFMTRFSKRKPSGSKGNIGLFGHCPFSFICASNCFETALFLIWRWIISGTSIQMGFWLGIVCGLINFYAFKVQGRIALWYWVSKKTSNCDIFQASQWEFVWCIFPNNYIDSKVQGTAYHVHSL